MLIDHSETVLFFINMPHSVDDMFVLLRAYEMTSPSHPVSDRIKETMQHGGVSIFFTSITDLMAFGIGSFSPFGAVYTFCIYCGIGVLLDFLFQITFFLAFVVYDSRYQHTRSVKQSCCGGVSEPEPTSPEEQTGKSIELQTKTDGNTTNTITAGTTPKEDVQKVDEEATDNTTIDSPMIPDGASIEVMEKLAHLLLDMSAADVAYWYVF